MAKFYDHRNSPRIIVAYLLIVRLQNSSYWAGLYNYWIVVLLLMAQLHDLKKYENKFKIHHLSELSVLKAHRENPASNHTGFKSTSLESICRSRSSVLEVRSIISFQIHIVLRQNRFKWSPTKIILWNTIRLKKIGILQRCQLSQSSPITGQNLAYSCPYNRVV